VSAEAGWTLEEHTASDGYRWRYRRYAARGSPRGRVVCVHGIQSHGGWYEHSCRRLAGAGYEASFLDRRGSGLNAEARGDSPNFRRLLDDVAGFLEHVRDAGPPRPTFLVGISWGGKTAVGLQRRRPGLVDGIALLCPGFFPKVGPTPRERLAVAWARLTAPGRLFPIPLDDPELFTQTPRWLAFLRDDPLALHRATARFLVSSVWMDRYVRGAARRVAVPALVLLAGRDRIIDNARTRAFVARFAGPTEVIEYPEAHHTLEFEPDPERFIGDLLGWLGRNDGRVG
jgi:alpha-beta hydrolase superfamily lysophospholipase